MYFGSATDDNNMCVIIFYKLLYERCLKIRHCANKMAGVKMIKTVFSATINQRVLLHVHVLLLL